MTKLVLSRNAILAREVHLQRSLLETGGNYDLHLRHPRYQTPCAMAETSRDTIDGFGERGADSVMGKVRTPARGEPAGRIDDCEYGYLPGSRLAKLVGEGSAKGRSTVMGA